MTERLDGIENSAEYNEDARRFLEVFAEFKENLDEDTYESVVDIFEAVRTSDDLAEAIGYLLTVAAEHGIDTELEVELKRAGLFLE